LDRGENHMTVAEQHLTCNHLSFTQTLKEVHQVDKIYTYMCIIMGLDLACTVLYHNEVDL